MSALFVLRLQFELSIMDHYLFPRLTIRSELLLVQVSKREPIRETASR
jgi:hypothetical protein